MELTGVKVIKMAPISGGARHFSSSAGNIITKVDYQASEMADVWKAGFALGMFLEECPLWVRNKRVIELGAGVGYLGILCAKLGAKKVLLTDVQELLPVLRENVLRNNATQALVAELDWGNPDQRRELSMQKFETILASDCIYEENGIGPFLRAAEAIFTRSIAANITPDGLVAIKLRGCSKDIRACFLEKARAIFAVREVIPVVEDVVTQLEVENPVTSWQQLCIQENVAIYHFEKK